MAAQSSRPDSRDTIAAIATAVGGGIGIVRLSGPRAAEILGKMVRPWPAKPQSHKLQRTVAYDLATSERIDEVLAVVMRAPKSYTGEDVAELQGHGGPLVMQRLLEAVLTAGARMAEPGEFTRRAFEAGRIDLTRAESVAALIGARGERALRAAQAMNAGALAERIVRLRQKLIAVLAELEGAIDFPEDAGDVSPEAESARALGEISREMRAMARSYRPALFRPAEVALVGRVNAGKSSLLNALVGQERAIVDEAPGTTRDAVVAEVALDGVAVTLVDTAGEREDPERLERRGLELGRARAARADLVVLVVDGAVGFGDVERRAWEAIAQEKLIAWNKRDLGPARGLPEGAIVVETEAPSGEGVAALGAAIARAVAGDVEEGVAIVSARQAEALGDGAATLERAGELLGLGEPPELAAVDARKALDAMGRVTGETVDADVLDAIFARFCIGK
ncbi:MAG TPA: tRNA uridine-5-carboxymethylaminomethyl(34) synthesis GTPase MnmE [Polyangia bacterium]|nr:tRNA uridine-5-carboxymethylaminomethyl(34) synthesis GTPase MnmE [Polyangia bacterium]